MKVPNRVLGQIKMGGEKNYDIQPEGGDNRKGWVMDAKKPL